MDKIITINRTFGSGGREIGLRLANELGVPFYDKDVISQLAIDEISDTKWTELEEQCHPPFLDESILSRDVFQHYQEDTNRMSFSANRKSLKNFH